MHDMSSAAVEQFALDTIAVITIMPGNPALYTICTHTQIEKNVHGIPLIVLCKSLNHFATFRWNFQSVWVRECLA